MTGRLYVVSFSQVLVANAQDLVAVYAGVMPFTVQEVWLSQTTTTVTSGIPLVLSYMPATVTPGSGGNAYTPQRILPGDAVPTVTARINDTVAATTDTPGGVNTIRNDAWIVVDPYLWNPPDQDQAPAIAPGGAFILSLPTNLTSPQTILMSGGVLIKELV